MLMLALTVSLAIAAPAWATSTYVDWDEHPTAYCSDGAVAEWYGYDHYEHKMEQYKHEWHNGAHDSHLESAHYPTDDHYRHAHINQTCPGV